MNTNKNNNKNIELLAPAGGIASLKAALLAGADAVYLSGKRFGARAFAANFDEKALRWARRVTKSLGKKMYVTLNTIVFENEWKLLQETLDFYETLQPDALIVQDIGVAAELKRRQTTIPLHLSTQGAWWGIGGEQQFEELGFTRIILPREMSISEIAELSKRTSLELEVFIHGAMCYSISGRCFWSAALGNRSGNRGTCAQPCRKEYIDTSGFKKSELFFSPKDIKLIEKLDELVEAGAISLKIEGRMKSPEYVFQTVKSYKNALDDVRRNNNKNLQEVYSRVSGIGFAMGIPKKNEWKTGTSGDREGVYIGNTTGKVQSGLVEILVKETLNPGDGLFWVDSKGRHGCKITYTQLEKKRPNYVWARGLPSNLKKNTELRRSVTALDKNWERGWNKEWERMPVKLFWSGHEGTALCVEMIINGHAARLATDELLTIATNKGLEEGILEEKFRILGDSFKSESQIMKALDDGLYLSAKSLKRLKRKLVENLYMFEHLPPPKPVDKNRTGLLSLIPNTNTNINSDNDIFTCSSNSEVMIRVWNNNFEFNRAIENQKWILPFEKKFYDIENVSFWTPLITTNKQFNELVSNLRKTNCNDFLCMGWEIFELQKIFPKKRFRIDWSYNISNLSAIRFMKNNNLLSTFSREWKQEHIPNGLDGVSCSESWNPLVSISRFPQAIKEGKIVKNSHKDNFFMLPLNNDIYGLFMIKKPFNTSFITNSKIQIDVALAPNEKSAQVFKDIGRFISSLKSKI